MSSIILTEPRSGNRNSGNPAGITPTVLNSIEPNGVKDIARTESITTTIAIGFPGRNLFPARRKNIALMPKISTTILVSGICLISSNSLVKNDSPPPGTPKSFGS